MPQSLADALPWAFKKNLAAHSAETTSGGSVATRWVKVAKNLNPGEAMVIKGRLDSLNIPAIVQQEALGAVLGLTVGPLGSANILVPEPLAARVLAILADTFDPDEDSSADDDDEA